MARKEAKHQGHLNRIKQYHGDFVKLAEEINSSDIVTLDRVICCYDDMENLIKLSVSHALKLYGVVYPTNDWWNRIFTTIQNLYLRMKGSQFRIFNHPMETIEKLIRNEGMERYFTQKTFIWRVHVFRRKN